MEEEAKTIKKGKAETKTPAKGGEKAAKAKIPLPPLKMPPKPVRMPAIVSTQMPKVKVVVPPLQAPVPLRVPPVVSRKIRPRTPSLETAECLDRREMKKDQEPKDKHIRMEVRQDGDHLNLYFHIWGSDIKNVSVFKHELPK
jgi:hypothetical protein